MAVKNIESYYTYTLDDLQELTTRHLLEVLDSSRNRIICSCGNGSNCGDSVLSPEERESNQAQQDLYSRVKQVLSTRETPNK